MCRGRKNPLDGVAALDRRRHHLALQVRFTVQRHCLNVRNILLAVGMEENNVSWDGFVPREFNDVADLKITPLG